MSLDWLRKRDEATRGDMVQMVNEGWPAGEALEQAMANQNHYWLMLDNTKAAPQIEETTDRKRGRSPSHRRDHRERRSPQKAKGKGKQGNAPSLTVDKKGIKYCGAYNSTKGCVHQEKKCPQNGRHACNAIISKGVACGRRDHALCDH